jgi:Flp pilus assembly protein TadG
MSLVNESFAGSDQKQRRLSRAAGRLLRRFDRDERGNVAITTAVVLPMLVGAVGMGVTYSMGNSTRNDMQNALDASVLAGVIASNSGGDPIATAGTVFQSNLSAWAKGNASGIDPTFTWNNSILTGQASGTATNLFGGVIGPRTYTISVNSAATYSTTPLCVLGLNGLDNGAFDINGSKAQFNAGCAVQANTNSSSGMTEEGSPTAIATKFGVSGGHKGDTYSPPPADNSPAISDPYASIAFPSYADCSGKSKKGLDIKDDTTLPLSPDPSGIYTFCGGIHIYGNGTKVKLNPGIYVMVDGPFWVDASAVVTGDQVMLAFTGSGAALQIWGNANVTLTSPTSGTYMNMQFMQDRNDPNSRGLWDSIGGSTTVKFEGVAYFPSQNFWAFGDTNITANSPSMAIVADKIWTQGSANVTITHNNPRNLAVTVPTTTYGARLIR